MKRLLHVIPWIHSDSWELSPSWGVGWSCEATGLLWDLCQRHSNLASLQWEIPAPSRVPCGTSWKGRGRDLWEGGFFLGKAVPIPTLLHSLPCPVYKHRLGLRSRWHQNEHLIICRQIPPFASIPEAALTLSPPGISLHPSLIFLLSRTWHSFSASLC